MADPEDFQPKTAAGPESQSLAQELPPDTRILSEAVIELNISRKNVSIYPPGHAQITKSIDRAYDVMLKLFAVRDEMTLGVAKDTLFVGQDYLDQKNPVYRDFALSLNAQGITAVTFKNGLDLGELDRFHRIITTRPEDILGAGGIEKVVASMDVPHVTVTPIDYDSFHLTEEDEIFKSEAKPDKSTENPGGGAGGPRRSGAPSEIRRERLSQHQGRMATEHREPDDLRRRRVRRHAQQAILPGCPFGREDLDGPCGREGQGLQSRAGGSFPEARQEISALLIPTRHFRPSFTPTIRVVSCCRIRQGFIIGDAWIHFVSHTVWYSSN